MSIRNYLLKLLFGVDIEEMQKRITALESAMVEKEVHECL